MKKAWYTLPPIYLKQSMYLDYFYNIIQEKENLGKKTAKEKLRFSQMDETIYGGNNKQWRTL